MSEKRTNKQYPAEFKEEAVALIHDHGYSKSPQHQRTIN